MAMLVYQRVGVKLFSDSTVVRLMYGSTSHPSGQPSWGRSEARCLPLIHAHIENHTSTYL